MSSILIEESTTYFEIISYSLTDALYGDYIAGIKLVS